MAYRIMSADSHFVERPIWASAWRSNSDRAAYGENWMAKQVNSLCENITPCAVVVLARAKAPKSCPNIPRKASRLRPRGDPAERLKEQDRDGVVAEALVYLNGYVVVRPDAALRASAFRAFNDWAGGSPTEPLGCIGSNYAEDIPAGVAELNVLPKGIRGARFRAPPEDRPYSSREYDPFWAAAQDLNFRLVAHSDHGGHGIDFSKILHSYMSLPHEIQITLADLVYGGVLNASQN
jgi:hypothetical protein